MSSRYSINWDDPIIQLCLQRNPASICNQKWVEAMGHGDWKTAQEIVNIWKASGVGVFDNVRKTMSDCVVTSAKIKAFCDRDRSYEAQTELDIWSQKYPRFQHPDELNDWIANADIRFRLAQIRNPARLVESKVEKVARLTQELAEAMLDAGWQPPPQAATTAQIRVYKS